MSSEPSSFSVAFLLSTKVSSGMALGFRIRYLGEQVWAGQEGAASEGLVRVTGKLFLGLSEAGAEARAAGGMHGNTGRIGHILLKNLGLYLNASSS